MIYSPRDILNFFSQAKAGFFGALATLLLDLVTGQSKPWSYYIGTGIGSMAAATSIPGFGAAIYAIGDTVDALLFKSPDGSLVRVYLNGIAHSAIDTYAAAQAWETFNINGLVGGVVNRIDFVLEAPSPNPAATGTPWLAIGDITVNNGTARERYAPMALYNISYSLLDADGDTDTLAIKVKAENHTIAQIQEAAQDFAVKLDAVTGSQITDISVTLSASLPGGLKGAPEANIENQMGATLSFTLDNSPYRDSIRIPGVLPALFAGKELITTQGAAVDQLVDMITTGITVTTGGGAVVEPANRFEFEYAALASATKSFRK